MKVLNVIVHRLLKEQGTKSTLRLRKSVLPETPKLTKFLLQMRVVYQKSGILHGIFEDDPDRYPLQQLLKDYQQNTFGFVDFTTKAIKKLAELADQKSGAKGGFVVFAHYEDEDRPKVNIMTLQDRTDFAFDDDLNLVERVELDTRKVQVACVVDLTKWAAGEDRYLSFVQGTRDLSGYFTEFVGCTALTGGRVSSRAMNRAVIDYLTKTETSAEKREQLAAAVYEYCDRCKRNGEEVRLHAIAAIVQHDNPDLFIEFAQGDKYGVDDSFEADLRSLRSLTRITYADKNMRLSFDRSLVTSGQVKYCSKDRSLLVKNLPDDFGKQFLD